MRKKRSLRATVLVTVLAVTSTAFASSDPLSSYHRALDIAQNSLAAHGSLRPIQSAGGFTLKLYGTFDLTTRSQGRSPSAPEPTPIAEQVVYDADAQRVAYDVNWFNYYSSNQDLREVYDSKGRVLFIDKLNRNGGWLPRDTVSDSRERLTRVLPHMLLHDALVQRKTLSYSGRKQFDGQEADVIQYTTRAGDLMTVFIDANTRLVQSVANVLELPLLGDTLMTWQWSDYKKTEQALWIPKRLEVRLGDKILKSAELVFKTGFDQSSFEPPEGVSVDDPPEHFAPLSDFVPYGQRPPKVEALFPGVYIVNGLRPGFRVLFVEFSDYVLAVDAPTGWYEMNQIPPMNWSHGDPIGALAVKLTKAISDTIADKPLRYVVLSHHHSDHIGGLRGFDESNVTFLAGQAAASVARAAFSNRSSIMGDHWHATDEPPDIQVVSDVHVIKDATMEVRLIELPDGNPKANGYLMVYLPRQKFLYTTAFIYPVPKEVFPPRESIPLSRYFVEWLDTSGLDIEHVYNLHGMGRVEQWQLDTIRSLSDQ